MSVTTVLEYCQSIDNPLVLEYFYKGEKLEDPALFFDLNPGLFELAFPSHEETQEMINKNLLFGTTHKLVISEYGFNLVFR
ncbi:MULTISPECIES: hypothetical protein [unclassified Flavobacterium]|uniref:hypothetical protein n=1 Tax=unclassified Flavobacterium TaxID=196869 RepID=UPI000EABD34A|nr:MULTISPECIES: hypothetical protein [unclassified Flavobacterium]RKS03144.1 hypothetical protein C8C84_2886 [Flavobacterium sp. 102]